MKLERLLAIVVLLLNRRKITASQLAERFEVSVRTVYRDIQTLNGAGIPIISNQGYEGGFSIPDNYKLSRQLLSFEDMLSILTTLKGINRTLNNEDLTRVIDKFTSLVPDDRMDVYKRHSESFIIDINGWGKTDRLKERIRQVQTAVTDSTLLFFSYTDAGGNQTRRQVEPHCLIFKTFAWYMLAYCRLRQDFRLFRLSRMRQIESLPEHFLRRNPEEYNVAVRQDSRPSIKLVLRFHPRARIRVEDIFDQDLLAYDTDGSITVTLFFPEDPWIISFVLSFGPEVEVISPKRIRKAVQEKCLAMQKIYCNNNVIN
jgi:predicted DNA-binding transcriptional regulator YafY